eukprot:1447837-Amphidinium_carterae.1
MESKLDEIRGEFAAMRACLESLSEFGSHSRVADSVVGKSEHVHTPSAAPLSIASEFEEDETEDTEQHEDVDFD